MGIFRFLYHISSPSLYFFFRCDDGEILLCLCRILGTHSLIKLDPRARRKWNDTVVAPIRRLLEFFHRGCIICFVEGNNEWRSHQSQECETGALCGCNPAFDEFRRALRAPIGVCFGCWVGLVRRAVLGAQTFIYSFLF